MVPATPRTNNNIVETFETFFHGWLVRQEHYLQELLQSISQLNGHDDEEDGLRVNDLIGRVISHYNQYYEAKSRVARDNVFLVFSPTWFTPFERTFLWIAGFKPGLAFRLVNSSVVDLSEEQSRRMERLMEETRAEERELAAELARVQGGVVAAPVLEQARPAVNGVAVGGDVESATEQLRSAMETLVECADFLRGKTVMEILRSAQTVKFLAAAAQLQLRIRAWGLQIERIGPTAL